MDPQTQLPCTQMRSTQLGFAMDLNLRLGSLSMERVSSDQSKFSEPADDLYKVLFTVFALNCNNSGVTN